MPLPKIENASYPGVFIPATYLNFLFTNHCVFVPQYNHALDEAMLETLRECFPSRNVLGVDTSTLILQSGGLHCSTMQIPIGQQDA
jgi:agmatine/peptidylarginine deiminase